MKIRIEVLRNFCKEILVKIGVPEDHAQIVADHLITAEVLGQGSHGVIRLIYYQKALEEGFLNPKPRIKIIKENGGTFLVDGDNGLGQVVANATTELSIAKAAKNGICLGSAINLGHVGILSYYVLKVLKNRMIAISTTNAPAVMAAWGGKRKILGTNPIAIGMPFKNERYILFDSAMSITSRGKIMLAMQRGERIPENWALDADGKPTSDPIKALQGVLLPDGIKGYVFALFSDMLCGSLLGGKFGYQLPANFASQGGFIILVINPEFLRPYSEYIKSLEEYLKTLKNIEREIKIPGERLVKLKESEVEIEDKIIEKLKKLAHELGCDAEIK
ncbi:MAG: Ldh family oxidoreductase [Archaeoglobaceae archaeon]